MFSRSQIERYFRTLLTLGRVSNVPTVWSNCLAGYLLGGGGTLGTFLLVCLGTSFLYVGGMFLNDAFDAEFDRQHRSQRPIPSGAISVEEVWWWATGWLSGGTIILIVLGQVTGLLALLLLFTIIVYDAVHKAVAFSPILMGACRLFLYLVAASASAEGVAGLPIWSGFAMAAYIAGTSHLARNEATNKVFSRWPAWLLAVPIGLALLVNNGIYRTSGLLLSLLVLVWLIRCLRYSFWSPRPNLTRTVNGLLGGVVLVDLLALAGIDWLTGLLMLGLFALTLALQRLIPAT